MRKIRKTLLTLMMGVSLSFGISTAKVEAADIATDKWDNAQSEIIPYADVIVKEYRVYNGILQYRRWNATRSYWVDKYWINV